MKICNKKGFTMVELLAVITIIAILGIIAVTSIAGILSNTEEEYYKEQESLMLIAGKNYFNDNLSKRPQDIGEEICVSLDTLYSNNYIGEVKNYDKKTCDKNIESSGVCAKKVSTKKYTYYSYLECAGTEYIEQTAEPPTITITQKPLQVSAEDSTTHTLKYNIKDESNKIVSYRYIIYYTSQAYNPDESTYEITVDSGWKQVNNSTSLNETVDLKSLKPGYYKVKIQAYNDKGKLGEILSNVIQVSYFYTDESIDYTITPEPKYVSSSPTINWYNSDVILTIPNQTKNEIDTFDVVITQYDLSLSLAERQGVEIVNMTHLRPNKGPYTYTIPKVTNKVYRYQIIIKYASQLLQQAGQYTSVTFSIDGKAPICNTTINPTGWTNQNVTYTGTCDDEEGSGCKSATITSTKTSDTSASQPFCTYTSVGAIFDNVGNMKICSAVCYKKDSVAPTTPVITNPYSGTTQTSRYNITATSSDTLSKIAKWQYRKTSGTWTNIANSARDNLTFKVPTTGSYRLYLRACDNAGNCSSIASTAIAVE